MLASNPLVRILETNHLTGTNYKDRLRNLRIVLISEKLDHVLDHKLIVLPNHPTAEQKATFEKWMDEDSRVKCYVLASMSNKLQSKYKHTPTTRAMITHLQELYGEQSHTVHFKISKRLFNLKMREGQSIHEHCMTVIQDIKKLGKLKLKM